MLIRKFLSVSLLALVVFAGFTGCEDDDNNPAVPAAKSNVMVIHASPDAPGVDLIVDGTVAGTNLTYTQNTGYVELNAGTRNVKVNVTGTSTTVIEANPVLEAGTSYSVFAVGAVASIEPLVFVDNLTTPASGKAHVRFIHLSPDAPAVDITLTDGTVLFGDYVFKEGSDFTPVDAGSYSLLVRLAGTNTTVLTIPAITLEAGKIYTAYAKGFVGGTGEQALGAELITNK